MTHTILKKKTKLSTVSTAVFFVSEVESDIKTNLTFFY